MAPNPHIQRTNAPSMPASLKGLKIMSVQQVISQIMHWLRLSIQVMVFLSVAVILAKAFGFNVPFFTKTIGATELCYLAGAYYLARG